MNWLKKLLGLFQSSKEKEMRLMEDRELVECWWWMLTSL